MRAWIALGSNLGESRRILQQAWLRLGEEKGLSVINLSHPYITAPVGMESEHLFVNAVGIVETSLDPQTLLAHLQEVERFFGRTRKTGVDGYQDRLLDLDLLYYGDSVLETEELVVPHPHIADRLFVLAPLAEVDPKHPDPGNGLTAETMYRQLRQRMQNGEEDWQQIEQKEWD